MKVECKIVVRSTKDFTLDELDSMQCALVSTAKSIKDIGYTTFELFVDPNDKTGNPTIEQQMSEFENFGRS